MTKFNRTASGATRSHGLSEPAADDLHDLKLALEQKQRQGLWPHRLTSSITIEFLIWWFHTTRSEGKTEVLLGDFKPRTRAGRPCKPIGERLSPDREVPPSVIRKLAGVDPVTKPRML
jgi:hypothetical protein